MDSAIFGEGVVVDDEKIGDVFRVVFGFSLFSTDELLGRRLGLFEEGTLRFFNLQKRF